MVLRTIETDASVGEDGMLTVKVPADVPPGRHHVVVVLATGTPEETTATAPVVAASGERPPFDFPEHDLGPWPAGLSLRREDLYDDWGR